MTYDWSIEIMWPEYWPLIGQYCHVTWILASDESTLITWPEYWSLIGQYWSRDLNTDLWLDNNVCRVVVFTVMGVQGRYDRVNLMFAIQVKWTMKTVVLSSFIWNRLKSFQSTLIHSISFFQCHSAEPEDVVEKLLEMTENTRSQVKTQNTNDSQL